MLGADAVQPTPPFPWCCWRVFVCSTCGHAADAAKGTRCSELRAGTRALCQFSLGNPRCRRINSFFSISRFFRIRRSVNVRPQRQSSTPRCGRQETSQNTPRSLHVEECLGSRLGKRGSRLGKCGSRLRKSPVGPWEERSLLVSLSGFREHGRHSTCYLATRTHQKEAWVYGAVCLDSLTRGLFKLRASKLGAHRGRRSQKENKATACSKTKQEPTAPATTKKNSTSPREKAGRKHSPYPDPRTLPNTIPNSADRLEGCTLPYCERPPSLALPTQAKIILYVTVMIATRTVNQPTSASGLSPLAAGE